MTQQQITRICSPGVVELMYLLSRCGRTSFPLFHAIKRESSIVLCIPNIEHGLHVWCGHSDQAANYSVSWPIPAPPACPAETWPNDATLDVSTDSF